MAVFDPVHPLQSAVIESLAAHPGLRVRELAERVAAQDVRVSTQSLYRTIARLIEGGIVTRDHGRHFLSLLWLSALARLTKQAGTTHFSNAHGPIALPDYDGERREFLADSLLDQDLIWDDIAVALAKRTALRAWYEYNSHPYYALAIPDAELRFYGAVANEGVRHHILYGNQTFLDRHGDACTPHCCSHRTAAGTPFPSEGHIVLIAGEYIVEFVLPDVIRRHAEPFFQSVSRIEEFDAEVFYALFTMKVRCRLVIRRSSAEAQVLREKIAWYFKTPALQGEAALGRTGARDGI